MTRPGRSRREVTVNPFDQASRYAARMDPPGFLRWLFPSLPAALRFHSWLDTRTLPFPGEQDRAGDTVACLVDDKAGSWWAIPIEFQSAPDERMFGRMLEYLGRLWREQRPPGQRRKRFQVVAAVVNLTGTGRSSRDFQLGEGGPRTCLQVAERNLGRLDAAATLTEIAEGRTARCILPWIPLMHGGGEAAIIERWLEIARTEPDARQRGDYGGLALVFAELAGCRPQWKHALEGWNMEQSQQVLEWMAEGEARGEARGEVKGLRTGLRISLEERFGPLPEAMQQRLETIADVDRLRTLFRQVMHVRRLEDLQL